MNNVNLQRRGPCMDMHIRALFACQTFASRPKAPERQLSTRPHAAVNLWPAPRPSSPGYGLIKRCISAARAFWAAVDYAETAGFYHVSRAGVAAFSSPPEAPRKKASLADRRRRRRKNPRESVKSVCGKQERLGSTMYV